MGGIPELHSSVVGRSLSILQHTYIYLTVHPSFIRLQTVKCGVDPYSGDQHAGR